MLLHIIYRNFFCSCSIAETQRLNLYCQKYLTNRKSWHVFVSAFSVLMTQRGPILAKWQECCHKGQSLMKNGAWSPHDPALIAGEYRKCVSKGYTHNKTVYNYSVFSETSDWKITFWCQSLPTTVSMNGIVVGDRHSFQTKCASMMMNGGGTFRKRTFSRSIFLWEGEEQLRRRLWRDHFVRNPPLCSHTRSSIISVTDTKTNAVLFRNLMSCPGVTETWHGVPWFTPCNVCCFARILFSISSFYIAFKNSFQKKKIPCDSEVPCFSHLKHFKSLDNNSERPLKRIISDPSFASIVKHYAGPLLISLDTF